MVMRDDILRATKRAEVTTVVLAHFSKAFDAVKTVFKNLHTLGISN